MSKTYLERELFLSLYNDLEKPSVGHVSKG
jgi:hypothetical protein